MLSIVCSEPIASKYLWGGEEGRLCKLYYKELIDCLYHSLSAFSCPSLWLKMEVLAPLCESSAL